MVTAANSAAKVVDVVIVGAGFSGMFLLHRMRQNGFSVRVFEAASDVGGTWLWNRYPGARCDVESLEYAYSFDPEIEREWRWTERYAAQPEILAYMNHVADRLDLRSGITFDTRVTGGHWDEAAHRWQITTDGGETISARHFVMATGCLSVSQMPDFPGIESFHGEIYHTGDWPEKPVDFTGKRVGVIGTGSSGVQLIPEVARQAKELFVFQRTPHFCLPAGNIPLTEEKQADWQANFPEYRRRAREETRTGWLAEPAIGKAGDFSPEAREAEYTRRWTKGGSGFLYAFEDIGRDLDANQTAADFVRARIRETVKDPKVAALLTPSSYPIGAKRICIGTQFYETFNRDNVHLVDVASDPISGLDAEGLRTRDAAYPLDVLVFATGFDAVTGALLRLDLTGADGARLQEKWDAGPVNYLGVMTAGFPNFYMVTGPGSPSVLSNVVVSIEQHVDWLTKLFTDMRDRGQDRIEPTEAAEQAWVKHCEDVASQTLMGRANSWYVGANIPGKPRVFLPYIGGVDVYRKRMDQVARDGYEGFELQSAPAKIPA